MGARPKSQYTIKDKRRGAKKDQAPRPKKESKKKEK